MSTWRQQGQDLCASSHCARHVLWKSWPQRVRHNPFVPVSKQIAHVATSPDRFRYADAYLSTLAATCFIHSSLHSWLPASKMIGALPSPACTHPSWIMKHVLLPSTGAIWQSGIARFTCPANQSWIPPWDTHTCSSRPETSLSAQ